jgi:hypothetical protein
MPKLNVQDWDEQYDDLWGLDLAGEKCPKCGEDMRVMPEGTSPDDYTNMIICPQCKYFERD